MNIDAIAPIPPINHNVAVAMVRNPSPISNYTQFISPIAGPAAVIKLSHEATTMLGK